MKQVLYTFLISFSLIILIVIGDLLIKDKGDEILYVLIVACPQLIIPLLLIITLFHFLILRTKIRFWNPIVRLCLLTIASSSIAALVLLIIAEHFVSDLIWIVFLLISVALSYYVIEKRLNLKNERNEHLSIDIEK
jgi:small-conductance mechanosensitive channel